MSCHLSHRLSHVHRAVSVALLCSISYAALVSSAQAVTIGKTVVTSAQHEPLAASIAVTDIRAADFSASLANPIIYQQMGLTPTDSMTVRFKPTSATSGQVYITTSKPVSKPFADLVLNINDNGQQNVVPKTLLMPLDASQPIDTTKNIVTGAKKPNLPTVSTSNAKPLTVRKGAPPPLISAPKHSGSEPTSTLLAVKQPAPSMQAKIQAPSTSANLPVTVAPAPVSSNNNLVYTPSRLDNGRLGNSFDIKNTIENTNDGSNHKSTLSTASRLDTGRLGVSSNSTSLDTTTDNTLSAADLVEANTASDKSAANNKTLVADSSTAPAAITDQQFDILNIQVTRQIQPSNKKTTDANGLVAAAPIVQKTQQTTDSDIAGDTKNTNDSSIVTQAVGSNIPANTVAPATSPTTSTNTSRTTVSQYQVQRNDSLWVIAQQIAQENNLDVPTVMKQIQAQNPDAFINKDANHLKADAKLNLPNYDVLPSQKNLETAISAQKQRSRRANTPVIEKTATPKAESKTPKRKSEVAKAAQRIEKPVITKTQTLPKAQFSVLAPGSDGSADGTQAKSAAKTGNGLSTDILATLKASRQETASQAKRLSKTSSALDSYTRKLQLQNQKLAELQARLKKLRNQ